MHRAKARNFVRTYKCIFPGCENVGNRGFFKFPIDGNERYQWLQNCHLDSANAAERVCQKHFNKNDLCEGEKREPLI